MIWCSNATFAQPQGRPFIQNFPITAYNAGGQNWDVAQGIDGLIYVANNDGILQYDGRYWRLITIANNSTPRALAKGADGVMYVGAGGDMGYLAPTQGGEMVYKSLKHLVDTTEKIDNVWKIHTTSYGVFFRTNSVVYWYKNNTMTSIKADTRFYRSFLIGERLYIEQKDVGLMEISSHGHLKLMPGSEVFIDDRINSLLPYHGDRMLLLTKNRGLKLFTPSFLASNEPLKAFEPFLPDDKLEFFDPLQNTVYSAVEMADGNYAFASLGAGVLIMAPDGHVLKVLNQRSGLIDESAICLFTDSQNGLWIGLNEGIARCEFASPWRFWGDAEGIKGGVSDIEFIGAEDVYVSTLLGLFRSVAGMPFEPVKDMGNAQTWDLLRFTLPDAPEQEHLMVASSAGVSEVKGGVGKMLLRTKAQGLSLHQKSADPYVVYAGLGGEMVVFRYEKGAWLNLGPIDGIETDVESITEDREHNLWVTTSDQIVYKLVFSKPNNSFPMEVVEYGLDKGVPHSNSSKIYQIDGTLYLATNKGLLAYNPATNNFAPSDAMGAQFKYGKQPLHNIVKGKGSEFWVSSLNIASGVIGHVDANRTFENRFFRRLPKMEVYNLNYQGYSEAGHVWVSGDQLYQYNVAASVKATSDTSFRALIRRIVANSDSTIFGGNYFDKIGEQYRMSTAQSQDWFPSLSYKYNTIEFNYSCNSYDNALGNTYSYKLEGHDQGWSTWSEDTKQRFTDLKEGEYYFKIKAKNVYGDISPEASFKFVIETPWHRTWFAYFCYMALVAWGIVGIVKLNSKRLEAEKRRLEEIVEERTAEIRGKTQEIEQKNSTLELQKQIIEKKNKDTTDSINYAKRILNALHTAQGRLKEELPNSFMFFRPKDIVSGDFFWLSYVGNKLVIAVVDCTGHGIPGAFMSVIGHALIKEVVDIYKISDPGKILSALHAMVRDSLHQTETDNKDGMDMSVCVIDKVNRTVDFAGARNPLIYIQPNKEAVIIRGDRYSIAGGGDEYDREFTTHRIALAQGEEATFYIFSDGYQDQFSETGNKLTNKRFRNILEEAALLPIDAQEAKLSVSFDSWSDGAKQIDDVMVVGFRV